MRDRLLGVDVRRLVAVRRDGDHRCRWSAPAAMVITAPLDSVTVDARDLRRAGQRGRVGDACRLRSRSASRSGSPWSSSIVSVIVVSAGVVVDQQVLEVAAGGAGDGRADRWSAVASYVVARAPNGGSTSPLVGADRRCVMTCAVVEQRDRSLP